MILLTKEGGCQIALPKKVNLEVKIMKKIIFIIFLIALGIIGIFAQKVYDDFRKERSENFTTDIERQCYISTSSFKEFKQCVEKQNLPICPRDWRLKDLGGTYRDLPCRYERKDYWEERPLYQTDKPEFPDYRDKDRYSKIQYRQFPNEVPETFTL